MTDHAIHLQGVRKRFGPFTLQIDELTLERGYVLGLVGQNGAGKSTTLNLLMNLLYPDTGKVNVLGMEQPAQELLIKQRVGYVGETPAFYEEMTVAWTANLAARYYPTWDDSLYQELLRKFALDSQKRVKLLSKGMRMKLALLLALSHKPELLILDEPTSGLDPVARRELLTEIATIIRDERRTVILSSHITRDIEQIADYVAILHEGRIIEHTDKESLLERWRKVSGTSSAPHSRLQPLFATCQSNEQRFAGVTNQYSAGWLKQLQAAGATRIETRPCDLDEILVSIAGKERQNTCGL